MVRSGKHLPETDLSTKHLPATDFWLYSLHYETPHLAHLQGQTMLQFLKHAADIFFVSTTCHEKDADNLRDVAHQLNHEPNANAGSTSKRFHTLVFPKTYSWNPNWRKMNVGNTACADGDYSRKEGMAFNYCIHMHMQRQARQPTYVGLMHGDMLLVNPFDARAYLDLRGIFGSPARYGHTAWHIHPQLMFIRPDRWSNETVRHADFRPGYNMDTGGMVHGRGSNLRRSSSALPPGGACSVTTRATSTLTTAAG